MLSELLPEAKRSLYELELRLSEIERGSTDLQLGDVDLGLQDMGVRLEALDRLAAKESKARKDDAKRRVQHLRISYNHLKSSVDNLARRRSKGVGGGALLQQQRDELFSGVNLEEYAANIDLEMAERSSLDKSSVMVDGYLHSGQETLRELVSQRERLKSVHKKVFDILNYLGLSGKTMRSIEKRDQVDSMLVYGGMLCVLLLVFLLWWYFKR